MLVRRPTARLEPAAGLVSSLVAGTERLAALARPSPDAILEQLIDAGALEAAILDAHADRDADHPDRETWRTVTLALGRAFVAAIGREHQHAPAHLAHAALVAGFAGELPATVAVPSAEAFTLRGVYPQMFIAAARRVVQAHHPQRALVAGLGAAGAVLSAVVTAALEQQRVDCDTVFLYPLTVGQDRLTQALVRRLREREDARVLLVGDAADDPFAAAADALAAASVPAERVVLLPGQAPGASDVASDEMARLAARHAAFVVPFETAVLARGLHGHTPGRLRDVSAGRWRELPGLVAAGVPSHPSHERRKYLTVPSVHGRVLLKFAGLGRQGRARLARAEALSAAGFMPAPDALANGFLALPWIEGAPLSAPEVDDAVLRRIGDYLAWLSKHAGTGSRAEPLSLVEMVRVNVAEALGPSPTAAIARAADAAARMPEAQSVAVDGRLFPHEWIRSPRGLVKTDALEHHDDPFFPGAHDVAWDLAGAISEFGLDYRGEAFLLDGYVRATGDAVAGRLPFYQLAYEAFRFGYDTLAARDLAHTEEGPRFAARAREHQIKLARCAARFS